MRSRTMLAAVVVAVIPVGCGSPSGQSPAVDQTPPLPPEQPGEVAERPEPSAKPGPAPAPTEAPRPGEITEIDLAAFFQLREDGGALVVDVRPALFYSLGHIPGAISLPKKSYARAYPETKAALDAALAAGKVIVLYCTDADCPDGFSVATKLAREGYSTTLYKGGWKEWKQSGLE